ncbi:MAG TPA: DUF58 domain-containing protein [Egicoccus sp.]|nr:DUF58 domain-containing protein [Egicoccus sp.]HSK23089.1 DUF58 domain-containing protein [Egicoccus sp.]
MSSTAPQGSVVGGWRPTGSALPRLFTGGALLLAGLLTGRFDVATLGVPLMLSVVVGLLRRPRRDIEVLLGPPRYETAPGRIAATLRIDGAAGAGTAGTLGPGAVTARLRVATPGFREREVLVDAAAARELHLSVQTVRTGRQHLFRVDHQLRGAHVVLRAQIDWVGPVPLVVLPKPALLGPVPLPHRLQGLTGSHRSVRAGDGGEFRDLAEFAPGDRLRRIDWKATARRGTGHGTGTTTLFVRRTFATADAHVMLVLDARDEVGPDVAGWDFGRVLPHESTSLDLARRAGTSLARRYLDQGDRVGLAEVGRPRWLRPAGGRRQLTQIVHHLALAEPDGEPAQKVAVPHLPSGVLVVVLSTFLDDVAVDLAVGWRFTGHRVVAVDVLPRLDLDYLEPRQLTAHRLVAMERDERLHALTAAGVEVVRWDQPPGGVRVEAALATMARTRRAGR